MDIQEAIKHIGETIFTYEIDNNEIFVYKDKIFAVGKDFVYINDDSLIEEAKINYFKNYNTKWFLDESECQRYAELELANKIYGV